MRCMWIDINKGNNVKKNYRSRVVAQEYNDGRKMEEDLFAATPPLEALRLVLRDVATMRKGQRKRKVLVLADVKKTFYEAKMKRQVCKELPPEDKGEDGVEEDRVGPLMLAMPGPRDATNAWHEEVVWWMAGIGFKR